jgi:dTDP-4-dehydrorhamnose 3,5-epimerase
MLFDLPAFLGNARGPMSNFSFQPMAIADVVLITSRRYEDHRGYLSETHGQEAFRAAGISATFVQDNESYSRRRGTIRGLHFQREPMAQAKLVRVIRGAIFDVAVDLRPNSPGFGRWCAAELSSDNARAMLVPRGFAHGFCTLADDTLVAYKVDAAYAKAAEGGIRWNDPAIGIDWPILAGEAILSDRDRDLPELVAAMR